MCGSESRARPGPLAGEEAGGGGACQGAGEGSGSGAKRGARRAEREGKGARGGPGGLRESWEVRGGWGAVARAGAGALGGRGSRRGVDTAARGRPHGPASRGAAAGSRAAAPAPRLPPLRTG